MRDQMDWLCSKQLTLWSRSPTSVIVTYEISAQTFWETTKSVDGDNAFFPLSCEEQANERRHVLPAVPDPLNNNVLTRPTYLYEYNVQGQMTKLTEAGPDSIVAPVVAATKCPTNDPFSTRIKNRRLPF
jgi:hypothetical protein